LKNRTGKTIDEHHATLVIKQLEDRSKEPIRDRIKYFTGAIAQDPNPGRFLPTPSPPRYERDQKERPDDYREDLHRLPASART
jgi:hypothetical protein